MKQSAETLAPFGEWYFSYYQAGVQNPSNGVWTSYTKDTSGNYGYVDIGPSGNDVSILVGLEGAMDGAMDGDNANMHGANDHDGIAAITVAIMGHCFSIT